MLTTYPAIFCAEGDGKYSVLFPDFGCATCGDNLNDAMEMAVDCLAGQVYTAGRDSEDLPEPSAMTREKLVQACAEVDADPSTAFWNLISVDVQAYAKQHFCKSVKKTLSIPKWMNEAAEEKGINFSQVLQEALAERLTRA